MVSAEIKYYDFRTLSHQMQLEKPSNESDIICKAAVNLFREVWTGEPVRLLGIRTSKLSDENEPEQLTIFDMKPEAEPDEKHKRLRKAMDELNKNTEKEQLLKRVLCRRKINIKILFKKSLEFLLNLMSAPLDLQDIL